MKNLNIARIAKTTSREREARRFEQMCNDHERILGYVAFWTAQGETAVVANHLRDAEALAKKIARMAEAYAN